MAAHAPAPATHALALAAFLTSVPAFASSTDVALYPLGELDSGASDGAPAAATTWDLGQTFPLTKSGQPVYSSDTHPTSGSTFSVLFNFSGTKGGYRGNVVSPATTNFGISALVKPKAGSASQVIAYNGNASTNGWGIVIKDGTKFKAQLGGVTLKTIGDVTPLEWTHVALVRDGSVLRGFINGVETLNETSSSPATPSGKFSVGVNPILDQDYAFARIDEVRVFTFPPGGFDPVADLGVPAAPVAMPALGHRGLLASALGILVASIAALLVRRRH